MVYYKLGIIFVSLVICSIKYDNVVLCIKISE